MKIAVFGTGYVGLVTGACFAERGHEVLCMDVDAAKVAQLSAGRSPIHEPGLDALLARNLARGTLRFTTDAAAAVAAAEVLFVAVGTPALPDGAANTTQVMRVAEAVGDAMAGSRLVVIKSTVPVGTAARVRDRIRERLRLRGAVHGVDVASNPEFLREGSAIADCLSPDRVVVGHDSDAVASRLAEIYAPFLSESRPLLLMDLASGELSKYAANAMLAARISLINELSRVCERVGADIEQVRRGVGSDNRIGPHFLAAGVGYGGSCFPKDVRALIHAGARCGEDLELLRAVESANARQGERFFDRLSAHFRGELRGRRIALWGLAFKAGTDDVREAPALALAQRLVAAGCAVTAYDPVAMANVGDHWLIGRGLSLADSAQAALAGAEALCVMTEWPEFRRPDFAAMAAAMASFVIFDGRNLYRAVAPAALADCAYYAVGVSAATPTVAPAEVAAPAITRAS